MTLLRVAGRGRRHTQRVKGDQIFDRIAQRVAEKRKTWSTTNAREGAQCGSALSRERASAVESAVERIGPKIARVFVVIRSECRIESHETTKSETDAAVAAAVGHRHVTTALVLGQHRRCREDTRGSERHSAQPEFPVHPFHVSLLPKVMSLYGL
nr:hypothetical protein [Panacagrimonas sp.]